MTLVGRIGPEFCVHPGIWLGRAWEAERGEELAARAASVGFDRLIVPLHDLSVVDVAAITASLTRHGLTAANTIGQLVDADISSDDARVREAGRDRLRAAAAVAADMGSNHLGGVIYGPIGDKRGPVTRERFVRTAGILGELAEEFHEVGLQLACEVVNRYETPLLNTAEQAMAFVEQSGSERLKIHLDTFHMNIEETDIVAAIAMALPRLAYLELSQNSRNGVSTGLLDLGSAVRAALDRGFSGILGVEAFSATILDQPIRERLSIWREHFPVDNTIAEDAIGLFRAASS